MTVQELIKAVQNLPAESQNRPVCVSVASNDSNSISYSEYRLGDSSKVEERYSECVGGDTAVVLPAVMNDAVKWRIC